MSALLEWSQSLELGQPQMDATHREFVELLNRLGAASDAEMIARIDAFIAHTEAHFAQENDWMQRTAFPPIHCHTHEHEGVLGIMREARDYVAQGKLEVGRVLARELAPWFENHAATMDAMLAQFIRECGFDPAAAPLEAG